MFKWIFSLIIICVSTVALAGEAAIDKSFVVKTNSKTVAEWLKTHPSKVAASSGATVVSRNGNKVRVKKETIKGTYEFTLQEDISQNGDNLVYSASLIEAHQGNIVKDDIRATLSPSGKGTKVEVSMSIKINDRKVKDSNARIATSRAIRGFQDMLEKKF